MIESNKKIANSTEIYAIEDDICLLLFGEKELFSDEYLAWMNDKEVIQMLGRDEYLDGVERSQLVEYFKDISLEDTVFFAIYLRNCKMKDDMEFIGTLKIYDINKLSKRASIGILIGNKLVWGKGYATKAVRLACNYIFDTLKLRKVSAGYFANNIGMEKAFVKNGFEVEAIFKEHLYYKGEFVDHKYVCKFK